MVFSPRGRRRRIFARQRTCARNPPARESRLVLQPLRARKGCNTSLGLAWRRVVPLAKLVICSRLATRWRLAVWPIVGCVWCGTNSTPCAAELRTRASIPGREAWRGRRVVGTLRTFKVGLHQCPSERNGQMSGCSESRSPSLVPLAVEAGAIARGFSPTALELTAETDSALGAKGNRTIGPSSRRCPLAHSPGSIPDRQSVGV